MRFIQSLRTFLISPEIIALLLPFALMPHASFLDEISSMLATKKYELFAASVYPFAVLLYALSQAGSVISPSGRRRVLIDWPGYPELKGTIYVSIALILTAFAVSIFGYVDFVIHGGRLGIVAIAAGGISSSVSAFTLTLAHWTTRELLGE